MIEIVFLSFVTAFIMLLWFKTDVVVEWTKVFGFKKLWDNFRDAKIDAAPALLTYPQYLKKKYNGFFTRLISCPFCLNVWLVGLQCVGLAVLLLDLNLILYFPIIYFVSLFIYGLTVKLFNSIT